MTSEIFHSNTGSPHRATSSSRASGGRGEPSKSRPKVPSPRPLSPSRYRWFSYEICRASDASEMLVVRRVWMNRPGRPRPFAGTVALTGSIEEARRRIPEGLTRSERRPGETRLLEERWE
jgi:hypothetical protein